MTIISLKDYAKQHRISYEAVRQQVVRYKDELGGHIIRDGRQQFLDEEAVAFLDARRQKNPVAIIQQNKDEELERLRGEVDENKTKLIAALEYIRQHEEEWRKAEKTRLALETAEGEKRILEGFIADANAEIEVLTEEKAEEAAKARQAAQEAEEKEREAQELRRKLEASEARKRALTEYVLARAEYEKACKKNLFTKLFRKAPELPPELLED